VTGRRRLTRLAAVLFFDGFRAAPGWMALVTVLLVLGSVASTCYPLGYRLLVDGAEGGSTAQVVGGVAIVAGLIAVGWLLYSVGATNAMALSDRIAVYRTASMIKLISGVRTLEHLERADYLAQVERLNANRRQLAAAPRMILSNASAAARIITLLVLLGSVSPWLLLLPVSAVPPMVADRIAKRINKKADDDMATARTLSGRIFGLTTEAASASEVRAYGLGRHLAGLHRKFGAQLNHSSGREATQILAVQATGWLIYARLLMGVVAFVVLRATDGLLSLGTVLMTVSLIRRSRNQLATAAQGAGGLVSTLSTVDRLFWLEDHAEEQAALAGTTPRRNGCIPTYRCAV
jgi:ATP-binding cassette subfamily B protein